MSKVSKAKFKFDFHSLRFKLWAYFALFAVLILALIWFLQVFFLHNYYEEMKVNETHRIAQTITLSYGSENFTNTVSNISATNDLFIWIERRNGEIIYSPMLNDSTPPSPLYYRELERVRSEFIRSGNATMSFIIDEPHTGYNTLAYATQMGAYESSNSATLYIFSPLYPVESTLTILKHQLIYVTIIALVIAVILGVALSSRVSRPLRSINKSAMKLAQGQFGTTFHGGHYTEIEELADTLTYTSVELEKTTAQQKDLMANVSHDLRTPLTMVKSYAEMIRDLSGDNPEKRNAHLQVIIDEADRLNLLVSDMLSLSRLQTGAIVLEKKPFSMKKVAEAAVQSFGIFAEQEGYTILLNCSQDITVDGDEGKIKQVLSNLMTNAIKYCGQDRTIIVNLEERKGHMHCSVTDHGMGIAPEEIDHIWDRYYKASTNHVRSTTGTGLGLSIVKEIVLLHGGTYGVDSTLGQGSTFWFEI